MKSFLQVLGAGCVVVISSRLVLSDFTCPPLDSASDCTLMADCQVCQEEGNDENGTMMSSSSNGSCSQCIGDSFLYAFNQCENCQSTFGNECLHCTDYLGCQQCSEGYARVFDSSCNVYICEEIIACDENCQVCQTNQNNENATFCGQCISGYFLADQSGTGGCLQCQEEYGDECIHCENTQGCQQCVQGYTRTLDEESGLHYCKCDDCEIIETITFDDIPNPTGGADLVPSGYFNLIWGTDSIYYLVAAVTFRPGVAHVFNTGEFGTHAWVMTNFGGTATMGSNGGTQFKLVQFSAISSDVDPNELTCNGYLNGNLEYTVIEGVGITSVSTVNVNNDVIIDTLSCNGNGQTSGWITMDNFQVIFV